MCARCVDLKMMYTWASWGDVQLVCCFGVIYTKCKLYANLSLYWCLQWSVCMCVYVCVCVLILCFEDGTRLGSEKEAVYIEKPIDWFIDSLCAAIRVHKWLLIINQGERNDDDDHATADGGDGGDGGNPSRLHFIVRQVYFVWISACLCLIVRWILHMNTMRSRCQPCGNGRQCMAIINKTVTINSINHN